MTDQKFQDIADGVMIAIITVLWIIPFIILAL